ncbi:Tas [Spider monkey simian foamy virus]|uniref:Tas n=1 Tax=Spider monkey simian foamy virus TaxID=2170200 RepID=A8HC80_9RETR|nr:Tas [Spider monkey simian foamy virus]ABV59401.1 Tas [Spider monkey simian foamy virus]
MASQQEKNSIVPEDDFMEELRAFLAEFPIAEQPLEDDVFQAEGQQPSQFLEDPGEGPSGASAQAGASSGPPKVSGKLWNMMAHHPNRGTTSHGPDEPPTGREPRLRWLQEARMETAYIRFEKDLEKFFPTPEQREFFIQRAIITAAGYKPDLAIYTAHNGWYACIQPHTGDLGEKYEVYYKCLKCGNEQWDPLLYDWDPSVLMFLRAWWKTPHTSSPLTAMRRHDAVCAGIYSDSSSSTEPPKRRQRGDPGHRWGAYKRTFDSGPLEQLVLTHTCAYTTEWPEPKRIHLGDLETVCPALPDPGEGGTNSEMEPQYQQGSWTFDQ